MILQSQGSTSSTSPAACLWSCRSFTEQIQVWNALPNYVCKRYWCECRCKITKKNGFSTVYGLHEAKNMKFNDILPLKWQNTADIVAILYGLKQETVSLLAWKSAQGICDTMIASFQKGRWQKQRFLHYSIRNGARNAVFATRPKGASKETTCLTDSMRIIIGNNVEMA